MGKRIPPNALQQIKQAVDLTPAPSNAPDLATIAGSVQTTKGKGGREGKTNITGWFLPPWKQSLRLIQLKTDKNFQTQFEEALIAYFRANDVPVPVDEKGKPVN